MADVIKLARELGKALQQDSTYKAVADNQKAFDECKEISDKMQEFYSLRSDLEEEVLNGKDTDNKDKILELDTKIQDLYEVINNDPIVIKYNRSKKELDLLITQITQIISKSGEGEDPDEIELEQCTGDCSTCGSIE